MGWGIQLQDKKGKVLQLKEKQTEGSNVCIGGTTDAKCSITFNYSWFFTHYLHPDGLKWLNDKKAKDCVDRLEKAIKTLGTNQYKDYWADTPGNSGYMLSVLLSWARELPEGIFSLES